MVAIATIPDFIAIPDRTPRRSSSLSVPRICVPSPQRVGHAVVGVLQPAVAAVALLLAVLAVALLATADPTVGEGAPFDYHSSRVDSYLVEPGDTLWSIAKSSAPAGEVAVYAERIAAANGGAAVVPGAVLVLPVP